MARAVDEGTPTGRALARIPAACDWLGDSSRGAFGVLAAAISGSSRDAARARPYLERHFRLSGADFVAPSKVLIDLRRYFGWIYYVLDRAIRIHNRGDRDQVFVHDEANAEPGEPAWLPLRRDGAIHFANFYLDLGPRNQSLVLIHEAAHFVSETVQDYKWRRISPGEYDALARSEAIRNADSFAYFAYQAGTGRDEMSRRSNKGPRGRDSAGAPAGPPARRARILSGEPPRAARDRLSAALAGAGGGWQEAAGIREDRP